MDPMGLYVNLPGPEETYRKMNTNKLCGSSRQNVFRTITTGGRGDDGAPSLLESPQSSSENHQVVTTCVKDLHPIGDSPSLSDLVGPHKFLGSSGSLGKSCFRMVG